MARRLTKEMREFDAILRRNGYIQVRCKGSHFIYMNRTSHRTMVVNKGLKWMIQDELIKKYNLEV